MSDQTSSSKEGAKDRASAGGLTEAVSEISSKVGAMAREAATNLAERPKAASADALEGVGRAVRNAADDIGKESPAVAGYVRDAAVHIDKAAGGLRDHTVGDLLALVTKFGRDQPVAFFAGAVVAGFALSRFAKVGVSESTPAANESGE